MTSPYDQDADTEERVAKTAHEVIKEEREREFLASPKGEQEEQPVEVLDVEWENEDTNVTTEPPEDEDEEERPETDEAPNHLTPGMIQAADVFEVAITLLKNRGGTSIFHQPAVINAGEALVVADWILKTGQHLDQDHTLLQTISVSLGEIDLGTADPDQIPLDLKISNSETTDTRRFGLSDGYDHQG